MTRIQRAFGVPTPGHVAEPDAANALAQRLHVALDALATPESPSTTANAPQRLKPVTPPILSGSAWWIRYARHPWQRIGMGSLVGAAASVIALTIAHMGAFHLPAFFRVVQPDPALHTYATGMAQRVDFTLADGSRVTLAPQSVLTVGPAFGRTQRTVVLHGEAYFHISAATGAPFTVITGPVHTRVLGTTFDVRHYPSDTFVQIAVLAGRVVAGSAGRLVTIPAGILARVTDSVVTAAPAGDANAVVGWTRGELAFTNAAIPDVLSAVGAWYGYRFRLADSSLTNERVTTVLQVTSRTETLRAITQLLDVTMTVNGNVITLRPRRGTSHTWPPSPRHPLPPVTTPSLEIGK